MPESSANTQPQAEVTQLKTDYLVVGTGAVGMAFADVLVAETDADIVMVDRFAKPGGHWNAAYPFVALHQPSQFYGVYSRELSKGEIDQVGLNKGLHDLATGPEVSAYFDAVMRQTLLPSGRVRYYPMCNYTGKGNFAHKVSGEQFHVEASTLVDCTYLNTAVPSMHTPNFEVADGIGFMPLNDLPRLSEAPAGYTVIGGGKTGIDAVLWLLEQRVDPSSITWIVSRDAWLINREATQPGMEFFEKTMGAQADQMEAMAHADSIEDMFDRLEECNFLMRIYPDVRPTMFHAATVSELEIAELQRIKNVVRLGRVQRIDPRQVILDDGTIEADSNQLYIDCSASALPELELKPIFEDGLITPQTVRSFQPAFSASVIAHVEATRDTTEEKNRLCDPVPLPSAGVGYAQMALKSMMNQFNWGQDPEMREWLKGNRLDGFSATAASVTKEDKPKLAILSKLGDNAFPAAAKLSEFIQADR